MISDNTIDEVNAKYWCMFMDTQISELLEKAQRYDKRDGEKLAEVIADVQKNADKVEETIRKHADAKKQVNEGMWDWIQIASDAAFPMAAGNPFKPNFRGMDPSTGVPSLQQQQVSNAIAGATAAAIAGSAYAAGGWAAFGKAVLGALGAAGSWIAAAFGAAAGGGAGLAVSTVMAIVGGLVTVSSYLYPRIAKLVKDMSRTGVVARCEFESDGTPYQAVFSLSKKSWQLMYNNNRWIRPGTRVPDADVQAFFQSDFFRRFSAQCKKYLSAVYDDPKKVEQLRVLVQMSDEECRDDVQKLLDAKDIVEKRMYSGKFMSEQQLEDK